MFKRPADMVINLVWHSMDRVRHPDAFEVEAGVPAGADFADFDKTRQILLVTYKRSGEAVPSPINHGLADGKIYVRTDAGTGKVKRVRNDPRVLVAPSSYRGKPKRPVLPGLARVLDPGSTRVRQRGGRAQLERAHGSVRAGPAKGGEVFEIPFAFIEIAPVSRSEGSA